MHRYGRTLKGKVIPMEWLKYWNMMKNQSFDSMLLKVFVLLALDRKANDLVGASVKKDMG